MPDPRSSTVKPAEPPWRHELTTIGVDVGLYFAALSSRLSSNWANSAGCTWTKGGGSSCN